MDKNKSKNVYRNHENDKAVISQSLVYNRWKIETEKGLKFYRSSIADGKEFSIRICQNNYG